MTAVAEPRAAPLLRPTLSLNARLLPALLLLPCLTWIAFFFLAPLMLMCWRSLASEGFSLEAYSVLFTSPLFTKVMVTTVKTAAIATVFALLLAYPLAYALTISGSKVRALILVFVLIPYWVDIIVRSFSWLILLGDNGMVNKALMGLGIVSAPLQLLYNPFSVLLAMVQILLPLTTVTLFGGMLRIDRTLVTAAKIHGASEWQAFRTVFFPLSLPGVRRGPAGVRACAGFLCDAGAARQSTRNHDRADDHGRSEPASGLAAGERGRRRSSHHHHVDRCDLQPLLQPRPVVGGSDK